MKIKDLTIRELVKMCNDNNFGCQECPLRKVDQETNIEIKYCFLKIEDLIKIEIEI